MEPFRSRRTRLAAAAALIGLLTATGLAGCTPDRTGAIPTAPAVVTFEVAGQGTYSIELTTDEQVGHAVELMNGSEEGRIPVGKVEPGDGGVNAPWTWHIDPKTLEFADVAIEVCDGLPRYVEDGTVTSEYYCPWNAKVVELRSMPG
ncbi:hypothetical protein [Plantibacter sp. YIM 135347]|jgi:hypothetical protein|uniref:BP74-related protein n=1 Tax=Plantibacter sp. YIM 135347 TaxID=3423919 RepID=UPI003D347306